VTFDKVSPTYLTKIGGMRIIPKHIWEHVDDPIAFTGAERLSEAVLTNLTATILSRERTVS
jgi:hypothetical protein